MRRATVEQEHIFWGTGFAETRDLPRILLLVSAFWYRKNWHLGHLAVTQKRLNTFNRAFNIFLSVGQGERTGGAAREYGNIPHSCLYGKPSVLSPPPSPSSHRKTYVRSQTHRFHRPWSPDDISQRRPGTLGTQAMVMSRWKIRTSGSAPRTEFRPR